MELSAWMLIASGLMHAAAAEAPPKIPYACGYATFLVCSADPKDKLHGTWLMVAPGVVAIIRDPAESPRGCVKIVSAAGRGFYVMGTPESVTTTLNEARKCRLPPPS